MWQEYIEQRKGVLSGKPVIKNTAISVDLILSRLSKGESLEDLLRVYPSLTKMHLLACISYSMRHFTL